MNRSSCFRTRVVCLGVAMFVLVARAATAQTQSGGSLTGIVVDSTGAVLPTANVEVRTTAGVVAHTTTDNAGAFRVDRLPRGTYDVVVTFEGFQPTTVRVAIAARPPAPVRIVMPLAGVTQEITVSNSAAHVKTDAAANLNTSSLDATSMEKLPVFDQDIVSTMSRFLDSSAIGTNGVTLIVNGVEMNNLMVSASAIQQIKINQDPYSAEYPRAGRGRIEIVLKPGSQEYHGVGNLFFRDSAFDARNAFAAVKPPKQRRVAEGYIGGPLFHSDKTSFSLSVRASADDVQAIVFADGPSGAIQQNVPAPYRDILAAATINHQKGEDTTIGLTLSYHDQTRHNQGVGGTTLPSAGTNWSFLEQSATYTQQTVFRPTLLNQLRLFVGQEFEPTTSVSPLRKLIILDAFTDGGAQADTLRTEHHFTLTDMLTWSAGHHTVKFGMNIPDWSRRRFDDNTNIGGTFYFPTSRPTTPVSRIRSSSRPATATWRFSKK